MKTQTPMPFDGRDNKDRYRVSGRTLSGRFSSPVRLLSIIALSVFSAELGVMVALFFLKDALHPLTIVLIDAPLLVLILSPVLYFFLFKPLMNLVEERKRAETALLREHYRLRKYLDVAGVIVLVLDREGRVELINRKGCEVLGWRESEILGRDWFNAFLPERTRSEVSMLFSMIMTSSGASEDAGGYYENPILTRGGGERTILWHNSVLREEGRAVGVLCSGEDITERKLTEKALKESEARYRLVHNTAFDGIIIANFHDRIIDCNDSAARIFGYPREELIGKPVSIVMPEKYRAAHSRGLKRFLETGESRVQGQIAEYEGLRRSGEVFPLELALNNFILGGTIHFTAMIRDITDRKRAEKERELIQARLSQSQKMEAIGRFAGGIAHDFNNILTAIKGNAELASDEIDKTHPVNSRLEGIVTSVSLASRLTRQLLLFSRGQPFELVQLDINRVVGDLLLMISRLIGEGIAVTADLSPEVWSIEADEGNIEQVIMNLAVNARDAMPSGGTLTIRTANVVIDDRRAASMADAKAGNAVRLSVTDTGVGMSKEIISRIFEPFFTTKEAGKGTGFGLTVVYGIVKQHGGWITVESDEGRGTTFSIYFPAAARKDDSAPAGTGLAANGGSTEKY